jgi:guanylate kinase
MSEQTLDNQMLDKQVLQSSSMPSIGEVPLLESAAASLINDTSTPDDDVELGMLLVISGPAGVGKDTVWKTAAQCLTGFEKALTCTTRPRREHEVEGVHYHFVSNEQFDSLIRNDELLEWAEVHGNRYGVPASSVLNRLNNGEDVVCVIDVQGACRIRGLFPNALLVFLKPPDASPEVLKERIQQRGGATEAEIALRLKTAQWELTQTEIYDYELVNEHVEETARELCEIVEREKAIRHPSDS